MERFKEIVLSPVFITIVIIVVGVGGLAAIVLSSKNKASSVNQQPYKEYAQIAGKEADINTQTKVTMEEYGDFECPACESFYQSGLVSQVQTKYGEKVKLIFRQFPLTSLHPYAFRGAEANLAAGSQGKFWEMHNKLYDTQPSFSNSDGTANGPTVDNLISMAKEIGVPDMTKFSDEMKTDAYHDAVEKDMNRGNGLGVNATPTIFLNGQKYSGNWTIDDISAVIDKIN